METGEKHKTTSQAAFKPASIPVASRSGMETLKRKLHPRRFPNMSPFMAAVVGYVVGESYTTPQIAEMTVNQRDNLVFYRKANAVGFDGLQNLNDLRNNWHRLLKAAGLTALERKDAVRLLRSKIQCIG